MRTSLLTCPKCGGSLIIKTMATANDRTIYRIRECSDCDYIYNSVEKEETDQKVFRYGIANAFIDQNERRLKYGPIKTGARMNKRNAAIYELYVNGCSKEELSRQYQLGIPRITQIIRIERNRENGVVE